MGDFQGGVSLREPTTLPPDSSVRIVLEYVNRDAETFHHIKNVSVWPTWNPDREIASGSDIPVSPTDSKRLLAVDVETPSGLAGRQGFHVEYEVGTLSENGERAYEHHSPETPLTVPVDGTAQYDAVLCTASASDSARQVQNFIQNWGFDIYLVSGEQEVRERFTEFTETPACFVGVSTADEKEKFRQAINSGASVALSQDVPALVFTEDSVGYPHLPGACLVVECDLESERALAHHAGPELLGVRRSLEAGTTESLLEQIRGVAEQEPKEFLRAMVYSVVLEQTGATEAVLESLEPPSNLFANPFETAAEPDTSWPTFRYTTARTGHHPTASGPQTSVSVRWSRPSCGPLLHASPPAVANGTVYIGSRNHTVYALDAKSGTERWSYITEKAPGTSPAVTDGVVYIGGVFNRIYALDAQRGNERWTQENKSGLSTSSPAVVSRTIYVGIGATIYALNTKTGRERWGHTCNKSVGAPAVADGVVYVVSGDKEVYALEADTGYKRWTHTIDGWSTSSPAAAHDMLFVTGKHSVYALDAETGRERWTYSIDEEIWSSPAVANGMVYIGSHNNTVYALDAETGRERWTHSTDGKIKASTSVADGIAYVGSEDGKIYALDAATGRQQWSFKIGDRVLSSPVVADGMVYVGNGNEHLYALEGQ